MPAARGPSSGLPVHFDDAAFAEDVSHATEAGRRVAVTRDAGSSATSVDAGHLLRCQAEGRDGTRLERCVKLYLPSVAGPWRMAFEVTRDPAHERLVLAYLAFGVGHPDKPWQPSAYQVAHRRLHPEE